MTGLLETIRNRAWLHMGLDLVMLFSVMVAVTTWQWGIGRFFNAGSVLLGVPVALGIVTYLIWENVYEVDHSRRWPTTVTLVFRAVLAGAAAFALVAFVIGIGDGCLLYTSPSPRDS